MGAEHPLYGPYPPSMTFSENLRFSTSAVSSSLPRIISYIPLVDLSMCHFHVTICVALNSGKQKSTFTFFEVVNFPAWVFHVVFYDYFVLDFEISLPITIFEMIPLSNSIQKNLNFALPLQVFIQPCNIGE